MKYLLHYDPKNSACIYITIITVFFLFHSQYSYSQGLEYNKEFIVNAATTSYASQSNSVLLSNGNMVISWVQNERIFMAIYDQFGSKIKEIPAISYKNNVKTGLCPLNNNHYVISWSANDNVFIKIFNELGNPVSDEILVNSDSYKRNYLGAVTEINNGQFIIGWVSFQDNFGPHDVYGKIFDSTGNQISDQFRVNSDYIGNSTYVAISAIREREFIVVWNSHDSLSTHNSIVAAIFNNEGQKISRNILVTESETRELISQNVQSISDSVFAICWEKRGEIWDENSLPEVNLHYFSTNANRIGDEVLVNTSDQNIEQSSIRKPGISILSNGNYLVHWCTDLQLKAQLFAPSTETIGSNIHISEGKIFAHAVTPFNENGFIMCFDKNGKIFANYFLNSPIIHKLNEFDLILPANNDTITARLENASVKFVWNKPNKLPMNFSNEIYYKFYLSSTQDSGNNKLVVTTQDTTLEIESLSRGQSYLWNVSAHNINSDSIWNTDFHKFGIVNSELLNQDTLRERLSYFPLQVGNYWQYHLHNFTSLVGGSNSIYETKVTNISLLNNGKQYYKVTSSRDKSFYLRIDSLSGIVYQYINDDKEIILHDLFANDGNEYSGSGTFFSGQDISTQRCDSTITTNLFGTDIKMKYFNSPEEIDLGSIPEYVYAKNLGLYYDATDFKSGLYSNRYILIYAKINGIEYGEKHVTGKENTEIPEDYSLSQNYPNPFNPTTTIQYTIKNSEFRSRNSELVVLKVYDILGREVAALVNGVQPPGNYEVSFDGSGLASGIYYYQIRTKDFVETKNMLMIK